jgi:hypothetical protein
LSIIAFLKLLFASKIAWASSQYLSSYAHVTDGVIEASAPDSRELFGFDRTQAISIQSAHAIAEAATASAWEPRSPMTSPS